MNKVIATAVAAFLAARYGVSAAQYWGDYQGQDAVLYGGGAVFVGSWFATYQIMTKMERRNLFAVCFTAAAVYLYAIPVGYRFAHAHDVYNAGLDGGIIVFVVAPFVALMLWPAVRGICNSAVTSGDATLAALGPGQLARLWRKRGTEPAKAPSVEQIEHDIEAGKNLVYDGKVDRDFEFWDGWTKKERVRMSFQLGRNTLAMPPREREATVIYETLRTSGSLTRDQEDRLTLALVWGDGRCQASGGAFDTKQKLAQHYGWRDITDVIGLEVKFRNASVESAISELFALLGKAALASEPPKQVRKLYDHYRPAAVAESAQWA